MCPGVAVTLNRRDVDINVTMVDSNKVVK